MMIRDFLKNRKGNVAIVSALLLPVLVVVAGGAIDLVRYNGQVGDLQRASDAAALAGARKFTLAGTDESEIQSFVLSEIDHHMSKVHLNGSYKRTGEVTTAESKVVTTITQNTDMTFFKPFLPTEISVRSEAVARGQVKLCALALSENDHGAVDLEKESTLEANQCSIFSNSTSAQGVISEKNRNSFLIWCVVLADLLAGSQITKMCR